MKNTNTARLLIYCPDQTGIVAKVASFLSRYSGNIIYLDQYVDNEAGMFFMRVEWNIEGVEVNTIQLKKLFEDEIAQKYNMTWEMHFSNEITKMAVFVSKMPHCLYEILAKEKSGEWNVEIPLIISNHEDAREVAEIFGKKFVHLPITKENKVEQESEQIKLLEEHKVSCIVLARYMQIVSENLINKFKNSIINIHHSFLPAFVGAKPYHSAYERGVKIIGATSHYVTTELDAGPIIEQDIVHVNHKKTIGELVKVGRDLEKNVLANAIRKHIENKILVFKNKTIIFE